MLDYSRILCDELWSLLVSDGGDAVRSLLSLSRRDERRGRLKRLLCSAIDSSSSGCFNGQIYFFTGRIYESIVRSEFQKSIYSVLCRIGLPDSDLSKLSDLYSDCLNVVLSKRLRIDSGVMVFRNGVLDVNAGKFHRRFDKRFVQMWSVDYDYDPSARTFLWYQFLNQVLPDVHFQSILQMFLGATFLDRREVKIEHLLILLGSGANGKSVVQNVVCGVLGEDYVSTQEVGRLCSRGIDGDMSVAEINGKRLNYCTEMEVTDFHKKGARLKAIVSGERVPARRLYGFPFYADNIPLLMSNANQIPIFNHKDDALIRRIYVIPFDVVIPAERQNKRLCDDLVDEYPGILNWILEGREKFIENGYRLPADVSIGKYIRDGRVELNSVLKFMDINGWLSRFDGVDVSPVCWKKLSVLYPTYSRWCSSNHIPPVSKRVFCYVLENEGGFIRKRFSDGIRYAVYGDITLRKYRSQKRSHDRLSSSSSESSGSPSLLWIDGVGWATSMSILSHYSGVSVNVINRLRREGRFDAYTKAYREKNVYDVSSCCDVMRELRVIATDKEKELDYRLRKELKYMRYLFNQFMVFHGLPYRKYGNSFSQVDGDVIVVDDDKSTDEVVEMARQSGYDVSRVGKFGKGGGAFSRGGKGFHSSAMDILSDE